MTEPTKTQSALRTRQLALAEVVMEHAKSEYGHKSQRWDTIVECWTIEEIADDLTENRIFAKKPAISHFREFAKLQHEAYLNTEAHLHCE